MKKFVGISALALLFSANALAADNANVNVSATVQAACFFDLTDYNIAFGILNPGVDATLGVDAVIGCSLGLPWTLTDISGARTMNGAIPGNTLAYSMAQTAAAGNGTTTVTFTATITAVQASAAAADDYTEVIPIAVNP